MALIFKLYQTPSFDNIIDKHLVLKETLNNARFLEPYDERNPSIKIKLPHDNLDYANYLEVYDDSELTDPDEAFRRYYFIREIVYKGGNRIAILSCELDLLMTYKDWIYSLKANIVRTDLLNWNSDGSVPNQEYAFRNNITMGNMELQPSTGKWKIAFPTTSYDSNTAGFVKPSETNAHQKANGIYVLTTVQTGYHQQPD